MMNTIAMIETSLAAAQYPLGATLLAALDIDEGDVTSWQLADKQGLLGENALYAAHYVRADSLCQTATFPGDEWF